MTFSHADPPPDDAPLSRLAQAPDAPDADALWAAIGAQLLDDAQQAELLAGCEPVVDDVFLNAYSDGELPRTDPAVMDFEALLAHTPHTAARLADIQAVSDLVRGYGLRVEEACRIDVCAVTMQRFRREQTLARLRQPRIWLLPAATAAAVMLLALSSNLWPAGPTTAQLPMGTPVIASAPEATGRIPLSGPSLAGPGLYNTASEAVAPGAPTLLTSGVPDGFKNASGVRRKVSRRPVSPDSLQTHRPFLKPSGMLAFGQGADAEAADPYALAPESRRAVYQRRWAQSLLDASQQLLQELAARQGEIATRPDTVMASADLLASSEGPVDVFVPVDPPANVPAPEDVALGSCDAALPADAAADIIFYSCGRPPGL